MPDGSKPGRAAKNMTITTPEGQTSAPFSLDDLERAGASAKRVRAMKDTDEDRRVVEKVYRAAAGELRSFIERFEALQAEKQEIADQQKEVMSEAKSRGYDTKVLRRIIALRKREPDDAAEEEAVFEMYRQALGM